MRYYVTADVHGYYTALITALTEAGFFQDSTPHKLIICGDLFDRGEEALQLQAFITELLKKDQVILIRGNHEDLALDLLHGWHRSSYLEHHHNTNGTVDTVCQLTGASARQIYTNTQQVGHGFLKTPYIQQIIPAMVDYYETSNYIFVHGWIPCTAVSTDCGQKEYYPTPHWRDGVPTLWKKARWINGMEAAHSGITEPGKTIVCGHWHTSFGHCFYEGDGGEFDNHPNFAPYYDRGIIALDACTALTGKVNCIILEDEPL